MTIERRDGPTPTGGDYTIAVWVTRATMEETDKQTADGLVISEYLADGTFLRESIAVWTPLALDAAPAETPEEKLARLGIKPDPPSDETRVIFVGSQGAAYAKKLTGS